MLFTMGVEKWVQGGQVGPAFPIFGLIKKARFVSVVLDGVLGPHCLACHPWPGVLVYLLFLKQCLCRGGPLKGNVSAQKSLQGSKTGRCWEELKRKMFPRLEVIDLPLQYLIWMLVPSLFYTVGDSCEDLPLPHVEVLLICLRVCTLEVCSFKTI